MNKSLLAALNDAERLLVAETETAALALLDEDAVASFTPGSGERATSTPGSTGVARAPGCRRSAPAGRPSQEHHGGAQGRGVRGGLGRVSRRLGVLAQRSATALRQERLEMARAAKRGGSSDKKVAPSKSSAKATPRKAAGRRRRTVTAAPVGDRALRSPASAKNRAGTTVKSARRQAKRDGR